MSRYEYYNYFPPSQPINTDQGIKAKSSRGSFTKNWWAKRWIKALERLVNAGRLRRGRRYARQGQVLSLHEKGQGKVEAQVQGSIATPYQVTIKVQTFNNEAWERVFDALANQALFSAQLLAGEMPSDIEEVFETAKLSLFPDTMGDFATACNCPDWANPCKHSAAVCYLLGELFDEDPFMLFRLRGRDAQQVINALNSRRSAQFEDDEAEVELLVEPLPESFDDFWQLKQSLSQFSCQIKPPQTSLPILKRLGQPSFLNEDILTMLGPTYQALTEKAVQIAYEEAELTQEEIIE